MIISWIVNPRPRINLGNGDKDIVLSQAQIQLDYFSKKTDLKNICDIDVQTLNVQSFVASGSNYDIVYISPNLRKIKMKIDKSGFVTIDSGCKH